MKVLGKRKNMYIFNKYRLILPIFIIIIILLFKFINADTLIIGNSQFISKYDGTFEFELLINKEKSSFQYHFKNKDNSFDNWNKYNFIITQYPNNGWSVKGYYFNNMNNPVILRIDQWDKNAPFYYYNSENIELITGKTIWIKK